jgi:hypothetical protein
MYGMIFAFSATGLGGLARKLWELQEGTAMRHWVDLVVVLDEGLLMYADPAGGMAVSPLPSSQLLAVQSDNALVPATLAIQTAFGAVWERPVSLGAYMGSESWGTVVGISGP